LLVTGCWLLHLADDYPTVGRIADAQRVEQQLRRLLIHADTDNPLMVRLNAR
jgi:hypothetical protein